MAVRFHQLLVTLASNRQAAEVFVNDDFCDCPTCEDEAAWTCETCNPSQNEDEATDVGVAWLQKYRNKYIYILVCVI